MNIINSNNVSVEKVFVNQALIRGDSSPRFNDAFNKCLNLLPPKNNLSIQVYEKSIVAKMSFDQWNFLSFDKDEKAWNETISSLNKSEEILATDYSNSQGFFRLSGDNVFNILNKITHFDFRSKSFPMQSCAQTLIARIDCNMYYYDQSILLSCNNSFAQYFQERLIDAINF